MNDDAGFPPAPDDDVEALVFRLSVTPSGYSQLAPDGSFSVTFEYHCEDCGGCVISVEDTPRGVKVALCKACGRAFGTYQAVLALCRDEWRRAVAEGRIPSRPPA